MPTGCIPVAVKVVSGRPNTASTLPGDVPPPPVWDVQAPRRPIGGSNPFGKLTANGLNNPSSFSNGMYDAMSRQADRLHPVRSRR